MSTSNQIAFFDFDGTITSKDSYLEFIKFVKGKRRYRMGLLSLSPQILLYYLKLISNHQLKQLFFRFFFGGMTEEELSAYGNRFSNEIIPNICYNIALEKINWHKENGHRVIIVTASSPIWIGQWSRNMELEIIGTQFETVNGKYTGKIRGVNCYGVEKEKVVRKLITSGNCSYSYGYGDTKSDLHFLKITDESFFGALNKP